MQPVSTRFPKAVRLLNPADFERVFASAQRHSAAGITLLARANEGKTARLGLAIAKKQIPLAAQRNRIRRIVRENFRQQWGFLPAVDVIVMARAGVDKLENAALRNALLRCFDHLKRSFLVTGGTGNP